MLLGSPPEGDYKTGNACLTENLRSNFMPAKVTSDAGLLSKQSIDFPAKSVYFMAKGICFTAKSVCFVAESIGTMAKSVYFTTK